MPLAAHEKRIGLVPGVTNHRVGRVMGADGGVRIVRCFHARFAGVKLGSGMTARTRLAYVLREGQYKDDKADVEAAAGDRDTVVDHADRIEASARVRRGRTAERVLGTQVVELPAESTAEQRAACAEAFVADWRERGHEAVAVVHIHGDDKGAAQPHLHVEVAARPILPDGTVDRSRSLWRAKPDIYAERRIVADLVNRTCDPKPPYHPGGFRDIGREEDKPKTRIPNRPYREVRLALRAARATGAPEKAEMIAAAARVVSSERRSVKQEEREAGRKRISSVKWNGYWKNGRPLSKRGRLQVRGDFWYRHFDRVEAERDKETVRADQAEDRVNELEGAQVQPLKLTDAQRPMFADVAGRNRIEGDYENDPAVQLRILAAYHEEREERRRKRREEREHDERGTGAAGAPGRGADFAVGGVADGGRQRDESGGEAAQERARGDAGSDGAGGTDRGAGGDDRDPPATSASPAAPLEPEVVAESAAAKMVAVDARVVAGQPDDDGSGDRARAGEHHVVVDNPARDPERGLPVLDGNPADVVVVKPAAARPAIERLRELAKPAALEPLDKTEPAEKQPAKPRKGPSQADGMEM